MTPELRVNVQRRGHRSFLSGSLSEHREASPEVRHKGGRGGSTYVTDHVHGTPGGGHLHP